MCLILKHLDPAFSSSVLWRGAESSKKDSLTTDALSSDVIRIKEASSIFNVGLLRYLSIESKLAKVELGQICPFTEKHTKVPAQKLVCTLLQMGPIVPFTGTTLYKIHFTSVF